ncbi:MAG: hypothetical protein Q7P63_02625 [Verrucomicrobiota bacterium JB022]|nr:hypothetical protein [Verrucomicrobiota bacterium JB022]
MKHLLHPAVIKLSLLVVFAGVSLFQTGCVVGRRTVDLPLPEVAVSGAAPTAQVGLVSVEDQRVFVDKPESPSTPSIDGKVATLTPEQQARMIGRQRNGYGMAVGDVALPEGITVQQKVEDLAARAFAEVGYELVDGSGPQTTLEIDVKKFWGWFTPGFVAVKFEAEIEVDLVLTSAGRTQTIPVRGYGINKAQIASDANWQLAYRRAFEDLTKNMVEALESANAF